MSCKLLYPFLLFLCCLSSCVSYDSLLNYEQAPIAVQTEAITNFRPLLIQINDILHIQVSSNDERAALPFQLNTGANNIASTTQQGLLMSGYLVDPQGEISYPTLGNIKLIGLTIREAQDTILAKLLPYFNEAPIVNVRLLNFNISVNGEVAAAGNFTVVNERVTVLDAITLAGDFTPYSRRDSVLIIRETGEERSFAYVDFNSPDIFRSPYFYLRQNDVVYVRPLKRKIAVIQDPLTRVLTWVSAATGIAAFVFTLTRL